MMKIFKAAKGISRTGRVLALSFVPISLVLALSSCGHNPAPDEESAEPERTTLASSANTTNIVHLPPEAERAMDLKFDLAQIRDLDFYVTIPGEVQANANLVTHVNAPISGRAYEVLANLGDHVKEGQTLVQIRSTDIEQAEADLIQNMAEIQADEKRDLMQADSDIQTAEAQLRLSDSEFTRQRTLMEEKIAARAQYEEARTQFEKDKISLEALKRKREATISLAEEKMDITREGTRQKLRLLGVPESRIDEVMQSRRLNPLVPVGSPKDGVITDRSINVGELLDPGKPLFTIADLHSVWLSADVYEKDVAKVQVGQSIELSVEGFPGEIFTGRLNYVAETLNQDTRTLGVRAEVENPGLKLKPDMFGTMKILVGKQGMLTVPASAVQDAGDQQVVYVPVGPGAYEERPVQLGPKTGDYVQVLSGLHSGERVVSRGSFLLRSASLKASS